MRPDYAQWAVDELAKRGLSFPDVYIVEEANNTNWRIHIDSDFYDGTVELRTAREADKYLEGFDQARYLYGA